MKQENPRGMETVSEKLEIKEYGAKEGIARAVDEIERLLKTQKYVVIAVSGSSNDVGKTYISSAIEGELTQRDIPFASTGDINTLLIKPVFEKRPGKGRVLVFEAESPIYGSIKENKNIENKYLENKIKERKFNLPISKIDIRVYVYRPDKPFSKTVDLRGADILIKNEEAFDDSYKIRG